MVFERFQRARRGEASGLSATLPAEIDGAALAGLTAGDERLALALLRLFAEQASLILPALAQPQPSATHVKALGLTLRDGVHRLYGAALAIAAQGVADAAAAALSVRQEADEAPWRAALAVLEARTRALQQELDVFLAQERT